LPNGPREEPYRYSFSTKKNFLHRYPGRRTRKGFALTAWVRKKKKKGKGENRRHCRGGGFKRGAPSRL